MRCTVGLAPSYPEDLQAPTVTTIVRRNCVLVRSIRKYRGYSSVNTKRKYSTSDAVVSSKVASSLPV